MRSHPIPLVLTLFLLSCGGGDGMGVDTTVATVTVSPPSATVDMDATVQLSATARNAAGDPLEASVSWSSSAPQVASVSSSGLVTGVAEGVATVSASSGGRTGSAAITVNDPYPPADPSGVEAQVVSDTEIDVSWQDNSATETHFVVEREAVADASAPQAGSPGDEGPWATYEQAGQVDADQTIFHDQGLTPGTLYRYRVAACNENGCTDPVGGSGGDGEVRTWETLAVETSELPGATVGEAYSQDLAATGGDGSPSWSVASGSLPPGLELSSGGTVAGTPTQAGTFDFQVQVQGAGQTATADLSITVAEQIEAPEVTTTELPDGGAGAAYAAQLEATGGDGTYAWSFTVGGLPDGVTLDGASGAISGVPATHGLFEMTVQVASADLTATADLALTVHPLLAVTTSSLPDGVLGQDYQAQVEVEGGDGVPTFSVVAGSLPVGLELDAETGEISGKPHLAPPQPEAGPAGAGPARVGTSDFTVQVDNALGQVATADLSITVEAAFRITTDDLPGGVVGDPYDQTVEADGGDGDYTWSVTFGDLPDGLALDPATGRISGTPTLQGTFQFRLQVQDGQAETASKRFTIGIGSDVAFEPSFLMGGSVGVAYPGDAPDPATGGDGNFDYEVTGGALPPGLSLDPETLAITGTPTTAGVHFFEITATGSGVFASAVFSITVSTAAPGAFNLWGHSVASAMPSEAVRTAVNDAFARMEEVVVGEVYDITNFPEDFFSASECGGFGEVLNGQDFEDVSVLLNIGEIDGEGEQGQNVVAASESCVVRGSDPDKWLPFAGQVTLDSHDLGLLSNERLYHLVWHQLAHVMGFGTEWEKHGLFRETEVPPASYFTGEGAVAEWNALGGDGDVPLETIWPTADTHWDESTFDQEIMSSFSDDGDEPISRMTIASLADLGWTVDLGAADAYVLPDCWDDPGDDMTPPGCPEPAPPASGAPSVRLVDRVASDPVYVLSRDGSIRSIRPGR